MMPTAEFPKLFRRVCADLTLAQQRMYGMRLGNHLNTLVIAGHKHLFVNKAHRKADLGRFVLYTFPQAVRAEYRLFWFLNIVFLVPFLLMIVSAYVNPIWMQSLLGPSGMADLELMYGSGSSTEILREEYGANFSMFCFYIYNNIGIDFRIFAGGLAWGIGTLFFIIYNAIYLGAVVGYIHYACDTTLFYTFVSGHSSFELVGMIIAGIAGMRLGLSLINPGPYTRKAALVLGAQKAMVLLAGAFGLTLIAAVIEGFWSAQPYPPMVKYTIGFLFWVLLSAYLMFCGRNEANNT